MASAYRNLMDVIDVIGPRTQPSPGATVLALGAIVEELRTANLIASAALIPAASEDDELRLTLRGLPRVQLTPDL